ncbi:nuclear transport factor 2 family protein [Actinokineospora enzanensis]|uniref:nuclear transport factor 2 family protein n=1 Tax=Actinokineospora enzanensis TaxID=155975 RepID=UPI0003A4F285|nr:nuclear transport factor 2 family protein [Actinokineospora enzanensis]
MADAGGAAVADRLDVIETCTRVVWHTDQREWERLGEVFADRVSLDYTSLNGGEPVTLAPEVIIGAWRDALGGYDSTHHLLTNHLVTVAGDEAVCTAAFLATHRLGSALGGSLWTLGGTYRFSLTRSDRWRIDGMVMTAVWGDGNRDLPAQAAK